MTVCLAPEAPAVTASLCRDGEEFAALGPSWNRLHQRCSAATAFQSHAWLSSWWRVYGKPGRLRILLVRRGGALIGAAALTLTHRPLPVLVPLGGAVSDFADVLVDDEHRGVALPALVGALGRLARHRVVDLREVRPAAAAQELFERWPGPRHRREDSVCLELPALAMDGLMGRLTCSRAQRARAKLRKLDAAGIEARPVSGPAEVPEAVDVLLRLHARQWQGRAVTPEHLSPEFARHLRSAVQGMMRTGNAAMTLYRLDGRTVAANLSLQDRSVSGGYLYGADPELRRRKLDVATMLLRRDAELAVAEGRSVISLLRGDEPYKHHWKPERVDNQRLLLAPPGTSPLLDLYRAQLDGRRVLARTVRRHAPVVAAWRSRISTACRSSATPSASPSGSPDEGTSSRRPRSSS
ncbi:GNAT family N-acetyltransferase [Streptomyces sp. B-S-A12]|uniref:GNAT family N-acetyltransferase n=2 Tax=Streptomyces luteolus TaxID=3043615 RepID=A0ABT6SU57_9ACTN|nr:GNAT family N-acetyltransferase [Streptomyces sp. B-S-A12]MDI3419111.1 GNAT family N-acetyltransferase [Streptomyces sp. B-S-A12]